MQLISKISGLRYIYTKIGNPSGKDKAKSVLPIEDINHKIYLYKENPREDDMLRLCLKIWGLEKLFLSWIAQVGIGLKV